MIFLIFIVKALSMQKEEIEEYQVNLMITHPQEDFIIIKNEFQHENYDQNAIKIYDKIGLIRETNHSMDQIIEMKYNEFEQQDQVWILYKIDIKSILSKQSIYDESTQENYYLNLNYECYTFYFITKSQIIIDCQNQVSNLLVLYDIQHQLQQSFYYYKYKEVRLRKLLQIYQSNSFVLVQQEQFLILCRKANKYQICNQFTYENEAHTVYINQNVITLISDNSIDTFQVYGNDFDQIRYISSMPLNIKFPIKFFATMLHNSSKQFIVYSDQIQRCEEICLTFVIDNFPIKVEMKQEYLTIQTLSTIYMLSMYDQYMITIKRQFDNEIVLVNSMLQEFYIANNHQLTYYGLTQRSYLRVYKQAKIMNTYYFIDYYQLQSYDTGKFSILFDLNFKFKIYQFQWKQKSFVLVGGMLNITFAVEDKYKDLIQINLDYLIKIQYSGVQYFILHVDFFQNTYLLVVQDYQLLNYNLGKKYQNLYSLTQIQIDDFNFLEKVKSFNQAYHMQDIRNGQQYLIISNNSRLEAIKIDCESNFILFCKQYACVGLNDNVIEFYIFSSREKISLIKNSNERFLYYDELNRILYLAHDTNLIINYYNTLQRPLQTQQILICSNFISVVVLQLKLIIICTEQLILYNKISNFRYVISGNIELYGQKFKQSALVVQNDFNLFYIIDNDVMHVFNSNLPLTQLYVTKLQIDKFDDVKSQNKHICFQYKQNLQCYQYQINIKLNYDDQQVEYHQVFKVNVCGENTYNKKCKQYITRLDQKNRKISVQLPIQQKLINKDTKEIVLDNKYFSGSIEKMYVNNLQLKPKLQIQAYLQFKSHFTKLTYYFILDDSIYILNHQLLLFFDIETSQIKRLTTSKPMKYVFKYQTNETSLILIGLSSISLLNCEIDCIEIKKLDLKIQLQGILYIHNNTLFTTAYTQLITYKIEDMMNNISYQPIQEDLGIILIDISQDINKQICMIYLNNKNKLFFRFKGKTIYYDIHKSFQQQGVGIGQNDGIYKIKLLNYCQILFINSQFGVYFIELYEEVKFLAEILVRNSVSDQINRILEGKKYLFYIQQQLDSITIFRFTYFEIYNSRQIDFYQRVVFKKVFWQKEYYFYTYNDELYMVQPDNQEYFIQKINLDLIIQLEPSNNKMDELLITLTNLDETKSFILEIIINESQYYLLYWIFIAFLIILYTYLRYYNISQKR